MRQLHYNVEILEMIFLIIIFGMLGNYLWGVFMNLKQEEHRNKILISVTIYYVILWAVIEYLAGGWKTMVGNLVCQIYGLSLIVLMGRKKKLKVRGWGDEESEEEGKAESDRGVIEMNGSEMI